MYVLVIKCPRVHVMYSMHINICNLQGMSNRAQGVVYVIYESVSGCINWFSGDF